MSDFQVDPKKLDAHPANPPAEPTVVHPQKYGVQALDEEWMDLMGEVVAALYDHYPIQLVYQPDGKVMVDALHEKRLCNDLGEATLLVFRLALDYLIQRLPEDEGRGPWMRPPKSNDYIRF